MKLPQLDLIDSSLDRLAGDLCMVEQEIVDVSSVAGRVLAEPLLADRDSPSLAVSAMDGYAIRTADLSLGRLPISGTCPAGSAPLKLEPGTAIRIFTGAPIPQGADCVLKREDTQENADTVVFDSQSTEYQLGQHIRYQGANGKAGDVILDTGTLLTPNAMAGAASFGARQLSVRRKLRVGIINTGDELVPAGQPALPWQIRDSNGPTLESMLKTQSWIELVFRQQVADQPERVANSIRDGLSGVDALLLTGGVSMGDCDFVPQAIESFGGRIVFHRLPIRPGRPVLGALSREGKLIMGLPGNPVSVAVTARRLACPMLRRAAGFSRNQVPAPNVTLANPDQKTLDLVWFRLVSIDDCGQATLVDSQGSGDIVSLARSDGFIEIPPHASGPGPWRYVAW